MNLVKATFVLLITVLTISNAKEHPDLVEEIDGMLDAPYMKYNAGKASDSDGDDGMSEDTSSSKDEDAEMMETIDKSHVIYHLIPIFLCISILNAILIFMLIPNLLMIQELKQVIILIPILSLILTSISILMPIVQR